MATRSLGGIEALLKELGVYTNMPPFTQSDILRKPIDIYRNYLANTASEVLDCNAGLAYEAVQSANIKDNSDLTLVLPKLKLGSAKPKDLAREAFIKFPSTPLFQLPVPDGVHLRFIFSAVTLPRLVLSYIGDRMDQYGRGSLLDSLSSSHTGDSAKKVIVEFSSPNLAKEFSSNHLRSTVLGAQIANLYENEGWDVVRMNYLGDWGKETGLLGVGWKKFSSVEEFQKHPMGHLYDVYTKISENFKPEKDASRKARDEGRDTVEIEGQGIFAERDRFSKRMEDGEPEEIGFWKRIRETTIAYYTTAYQRLNVEFDEFSGESQVSPESIAEVESALKAKGVYEESDGSWIIDYSKHGPRSLGVSTLRDRTGITSYLLRDIAAALERSKKHAFDKMIYVVTAEQDVHFQKVFQALRYMGHDDLAAKLEHISFGKVQGLSQQLGEVHLLGEILDGATKDALDALESLESDEIDHTKINISNESAETIGITSLIAQFCGLSKRTTSYTLNTKKPVSFEGETGPSLQLCYARLCVKIDESNPDEATLANIDYTYLQEDPWTEVIRILAQYPDVADAAFRSHEPSIVLAFLFRVGEELSNCLEEEESDNNDDDAENEEAGGADSKEPPEAILAQTVLYKLARQVFNNGLKILGITPIT
ncbi:arginyl-tRNA synthetase [Hypoxylon sp. FL1857]|nr:arginyl-tRNA synthetase [Hypoxylon sp. FL1857]